MGSTRLFLRCWLISSEGGTWAYSDSHNAFVKGRQILDSVLIASKCIDSRLRIGIPRVLCNLDVCFSAVDFQINGENGLSVAFQLSNFPFCSMVAHLISLEALVGFDKGIPYLHFFFILLWRY